MLAHVFEAAGIATVALSLVREQAEAVRAPRTLHCEFPFGRPLGAPGAVELQLDVLRRALALVARTDSPVLEVHPVTIEDRAEEPLACPIPPRFDATAPPAVAEARGLRAAYERQRAASGRTFVGRVTDADGVPDLVARFVRIAAGASLAEVGFDEHQVIAASQDVRAYYEEAALGLVDHVPAARQVESWLYGSTETGAVLRSARDALREAGVGPLVQGYLMPATQ